MKRSYVKSLPEYKQAFEFDAEKILEAYKRNSKERKMPTSVALEKKTIEELKKTADKKGIAYQVLMRMFILDGLKRIKGVA